jgi:hypothetical protein
VRYRILVALVLAGLACDWLEYDYRVAVEVTGSTGTQFTGWYSTTRRGADTVAAAVPAQWTVPVRSADDAISVRFCKDATSGTLTVRLIADGELKREQSTALPGGVVDLYWCPSG